jgi:hypothetical protein
MLQEGMNGGDSGRKMPGKTGSGIIQHGKTTVAGDLAALPGNGLFRLSSAIEPPAAPAMATPQVPLAVYV